VLFADGLLPLVGPARDTGRFTTRKLQPLLASHGHRMATATGLRRCWVGSRGLRVDGAAVAGSQSGRVVACRGASGGSLVRFVRSVGAELSRPVLCGAGGGVVGGVRGLWVWCPPPPPLPPSGPPWWGLVFFFLGVGR